RRNPPCAANPAVPSSLRCSAAPARTATWDLLVSPASLSEPLSVGYRLPGEYCTGRDTPLVDHLGIVLRVEKLAHECPALLTDPGERIAHSHDGATAFGLRPGDVDEADVRALREPRITGPAFQRTVVDDDPRCLDAAVGPCAEDAAALDCAAQHDGLPARRPAALAFRGEHRKHARQGRLEPKAADLGGGRRCRHGRTPQCEQDQ